MRLGYKQKKMFQIALSNNIIYRRDFDNTFTYSDKQTDKIISMWEAREWISYSNTGGKFHVHRDTIIDFLKEENIYDKVIG